MDVTAEISRENARLRKLQKAENGKLAKEAYEEENRLYFNSIVEPPTLFVEVKKIVAPYIYADIRNLIVLLIYENFRLDKWVQLEVVMKSSATETSDEDDGFGCNIDDSKFLLLRLSSSISSNYNKKPFSAIEEDTEKREPNVRNEHNIAKTMKGAQKKHPSVTVTDKRLTICGLSSVLRFILKYVCHKIEKGGTSCKDSTDLEQLAKFKQFLGFRGGCLSACAESSVWTKFCEVDMVNTVNYIPIHAHLLKESHEVAVPENLVQFENHLSLPVKIHNFSKKVQDTRKADASQNLSNSLRKEFNLKIQISDVVHEYAEGPTLLLSDLILYPSVHSYVTYFGREAFKRLLPVSFNWYEKVHRFYHVYSSASSKVNISHDFSLDTIGILDNAKAKWFMPEIPIQSLYSKDPKRYNPKLRQFTRQHEIDESLEFMKAKGIIPCQVHEKDPSFRWEDIPSLAHPEGGSLPVSRRDRKCDQLASMAIYALEVYRAKLNQCKEGSTRKCRFRIVDFCSGGGHVGILLAWLLPECDVVLVENKNESLRRAQERVCGLGLSNVFFYQSNLDYFESDFDLGLALHACGTATDLVIAKCVAANASFVCSPCCYGAIQENHILTYPRSSTFQQSGIPLRCYFVLCHTSDHTHGEAHEKTTQGKKCMTFIDSDRCLYGVDNGYDVKLCRMVPETASPKNHILVGVSALQKVSR